MADHPETTALRLAEAATEGPWYLSIAGDHEQRITVRARRGALGPLLADIERSAGLPTAAHIAHAHPGRVRAWLGAVARLRERAEEGHSSECVKRFRPAMDCQCGHDLDLAALAAVDAEG